MQLQLWTVKYPWPDSNHLTPCSPLEMWPELLRVKYPWQVSPPCLPTTNSCVHRLPHLHNHRIMGLTSARRTVLGRQQPPLQAGAGANDPGCAGCLPLSPANDMVGRDQLAANGSTVSCMRGQHPPTTAGLRRTVRVSQPSQRYRQ